MPSSTTTWSWLGPVLVLAVLLQCTPARAFGAGNIRESCLLAQSRRLRMTGLTSPLRAPRSASYAYLEGKPRARIHPLLHSRRLVPDTAIFALPSVRRHRQGISTWRHRGRPRGTGKGSRRCSRHARRPDWRPARQEVGRTVSVTRLWRTVCPANACANPRGPDLIPTPPAATSNASTSGTGKPSYSCATARIL